MKSERWQKLNELFHAALAHEPAMRPAFLDEACASDELLRKQVAVLLDGYDKAGNFIENDALKIEARALANDQEVPGSISVVGEVLDHYRIIALLGAGGMGEVYLAHDTKLGREVALKVLSDRFTHDAERVLRFQQEARAASSLNHPNIITIYEIGEVDGQHFIATEYIDGETLRKHISDSQSTVATDGMHVAQISKSLSIAMQVADALAAAHAKGIVHRDIKPENIMLVRDRRLMRSENLVKVLDFGIAKLTEPQPSKTKTEATTRILLNTREGSAIGTVSHMSPEQARGEKVDARTDVWSLGVVLYEMLSNTLPFGGRTTQDVIASILKDEPEPLSLKIPDRLRWIVEKALRKDSEERYQTARELFSDLHDLHKGRLEVGTATERTLAPRRSEERVAGSVAHLRRHTDEGGLTTFGRVQSLFGRVRRHWRSLFNQRNIVSAVAALLIIASGAGAYFYFMRERADAIDSIAVLPFVNESNNPDAESLSDGISGSLINSLSQLPQLKVIAQSSTLKYKGKEIDPQEVANSLQVQAIVTGRIVRLGDNLQISVELVEARQKTQMWGEQYNRKAADLQAVQGEIARTILEKLRLKLTGAQEQQVTKRATENPEAYQHYLNGELYTRKTGIANNRKALNYYNQALALDPNFALAYVGVAEAYCLIGGSPGFDPKPTRAKAKAAVERALELDETLPRAHNWLGMIRKEEWDWPGAEREFKRALELSPNFSGANGLYPFYLTVMGRHSEALAVAKRAEELDPLHVRPKYSEGVVLFNARRYDEAIKQMHNVLELQPGFSFAHFYIGASYAMKGMYAEAIAEYLKENSNEGETTSVQAYLGYAYAMSGKHGEALTILNKLKATKEYVSPAELAILYAGLGDKEEAFQSLERAYEAHDLQLQYLKVEPHYDSLRSDQRFAGLMRRVGLPL
jgi:serine/threonine protein kinase/Tfp pilus assembly protein PilF